MERNVQYSAADVQALRVRLAWANLDILTDDLKDIQVLVAGDADSVQELILELDEGVLAIEQPQFGFSFGRSSGQWMQVCLRMPRAFLGEIEAGTISGALSARTVCANVLNLETVSGSLHVQRLRAVQELNLRTVSGSISAHTVSAPKAYLRTISGSLNARAISIPTLRVATVSARGALECAAAFETLEIQSVSGSIELALPCATVRADLRALSGKLVLDGVANVSDADAPYVSATMASGGLKITRCPEA